MFASRVPAQRGGPARRGLSGFVVSGAAEAGAARAEHRRVCSPRGPAPVPSRERGRLCPKPGALRRLLLSFCKCHGENTSPIRISQAWSRLASGSLLLTSWSEPGRYCALAEIPAPPVPLLRAESCEAGGCWGRKGLICLKQTNKKSPQSEATRPNPQRKTRESISRKKSPSAWSSLALCSCVWLCSPARGLLSGPRRVHSGSDPGSAPGGGDAGLGGRAGQVQPSACPSPACPEGWLGVQGRARTAGGFPRS